MSNFDSRDSRDSRSSRPERPERPERSGRPERPERPKRPTGRPDRERDGQRDGQRGGQREVIEDRDPFNIRSVRVTHDAPPIPEGVKPADLDRVARNELKTLDKENAEGVANHLVMAAKLIDEDPALAHQHAISAARRAGRIGVVRETLAITAYATGDYALALRELRTYRRITGRDDQLPMMVDSERALNRPDKALELGRSVPRKSLPVPVQVELAIAMSGARLDLGQLDAALTELVIPQLDPTAVYAYSPNLFAAYATVLEDLGRQGDADLWWGYADTALEALDDADPANDPTLHTITITEDDDDDDADDEDAEDDDADADDEHDGDDDHVDD